jgi:competence protein ComEA
MSLHISKRLTGSVAAILFAFFAFTTSAWAVVEVNAADASQLESIKGIGPGLSGKILTERKQGNFKDWSDFEARVVGVGEKNAAGFSRAGLTVAGKAKDGAPASGASVPAAKTVAKKTADGTGAKLARQ